MDPLSPLNSLNLVNTTWNSDHTGHITIIRLSKQILSRQNLYWKSALNDGIIDYFKILRLSETAFPLMCGDRKPIVIDISSEDAKGQNSKHLILKPILSALNSKHQF